MSKAANNEVVPFRSQSCVCCSGNPERSGRIGCVRFRACIGDFSSMASTIAWSGGFMYKPTISRTFSRKKESVDNLKFSRRCGCNPKACQIRTTARCDKPTPGPGCACSSGSRSEEHTSELQSLRHLVCRLLLEKKQR